MKKLVTALALVPLVASAGAAQDQAAAAAGDSDKPSTTPMPTRPMPGYAAANGSTARLDRLMAQRRISGADPDPNHPLCSCCASRRSSRAANNRPPN